MLRRLLFLAFTVALVVGLTFPVSAVEKNDDDDGDDDRKNKYVFFAKCDCAWKVDIDVKYYDVFDAPIFCNEMVYKEFKVEYEITSIKVETTLVYPTHLKATCDLGQRNVYKDFKGFEGSCEAEFCEIEFMIFKKKGHHGHDD